MAAVNTTIKKARAFGPHNHPATVYYGQFVVPTVAGNFHLWDLPPNVRVIDAYVEVTVVASGGTPGNYVLGIIQDDDATTVAAATEIVIPATSRTALALTRMPAGSHQNIVPEPTSANERYVLVLNCEAAGTSAGGTYRVMALAVRDDLS